MKNYEWINPKKELPQEGIRVLTKDKEGHVEINERYSSSQSWGWDTNISDDFIVGWMFLPD